MTLTPDQLQQLLDAMRIQIISFAASTLSPQSLSTEEVNLLTASGINVGELYRITDDPILLNFHLGLLSQAIGQTAAQNITFEQLKRYIQSNRHILLTQTEQATIISVKNQALSDIRAHQGKIFQDINSVVNHNAISARAGHEDIIRENIAQGLADHKTAKQISVDLAKLTGDWSRNFYKSVSYICHTALNEGRLAMIQRREGHSGRVYFQVQKDACVFCNKLYLTSGQGSEPKVFQINDLLSNGSNIGRKQSDWKPVVGPVHPHCFDDQTEVLTNKGFKFFKDLDRTEKFLSFDLNNGNGKWVNAVKYVNQHYLGPMHYYHSKSFNLMTTPNHYHVIKQADSKAPMIFVETNDLKTSHVFVRNLPSWEGEDEKIIFDNIEYEPILFAQFLGYFISEGCVTYGNYLHNLVITQSEKKYTKEIKQCLNKIFPNKHIGYTTSMQFTTTLSLKKYSELIQFLKSFGKSNYKFVPDFIKNGSQVVIKSFLLAFCQGDGSFIANNNWGKHKHRDFYTSSKRLADDVIEMLLKTGSRGTLSKLKNYAVFDKRNGKTYTSKLDLWRVTEVNSKHAHVRTQTHEIINYNGFIYDVELEKFHTLFVRRNGKVTVSGNCRCLLTEYIDGEQWENNRYTIPKQPIYHPRIDRKKVRIVFNNTEYFV